MRSGPDRLEGKYALGLDLDNSGFDASVLTEFRTRLLADGQAERLLTLMLERLRERGLLDKGGRQRADATHVHMAVRDLHRLEQVYRDPAGCARGPGMVAPAGLADGDAVQVLRATWTQQYLADGQARQKGMACVHDRAQAGSLRPGQRQGRTRQKTGSI